MKKIIKDLDKFNDQHARTKLFLPKGMSWAEMAFDPVLFQMGVNRANVGLGNFGMIEARLLITGEELAMGLALEKDPGEDLKSKRKWCFMATIDQIVPVMKMAASWRGTTTHDC